jgi:hypothetical protein
VSQCLQNSGLQTVHVHLLLDLSHIQIIEYTIAEMSQNQVRIALQFGGDGRYEDCGWPE